VQFGVSLQGRALLADRDAITTLALRAEALAYDSVWVTDRLLIPAESRTAYAGSATRAFPFPPETPWLEALTAVTYLATVTRRIHVGTSVLVIPYRHPVQTAKALATADYLSGGRIILGAGIGWWREEFDALGVPFADRAARTLEYLRIIKAVWTESRLTWPGPFLSVADAGGLFPHPVQRPHVPIWIGGHSDGALRRVVAVGDGWHPLGLRPPGTLEPPEMAAKVRILREWARAAGRDPAAITISFKAPIAFQDGASPGRATLTGSPAEIVEDLRAYVAAGVQYFVIDFAVTTLPAMLETLERFAAEVRPALRG
jgi:probable F420-dependent oxidoreductase